MIQIPIILLVLLIILIISLLFFCIFLSTNLVSTKNALEIKEKWIENYKTTIARKNNEIKEFDLAFLTLTSLFYTVPKSLSNFTIKKSFEIKENGEVTNTIKVAQADKKVKKVRQKGKLYFEYLDYKYLIEYENIKLACSSTTPQEFNKYYQEFVKPLEEMKKENK